MLYNLKVLTSLKLGAKEHVSPPIQIFQGLLAIIIDLTLSQSSKVFRLISKDMVYHFFYFGPSFQQKTTYADTEAAYAGAAAAYAGVATDHANISAAYAGAEAAYAGAMVVYACTAILKLTKPS